MTIDKKRVATPPMEITQFKIVEKEYEIAVPKFVETIVEVPRYTDVEYEKPVIREREYERPVVNEKDITKGLREMVMVEVKKGIAEAIQSLKIAFEIPMARVLQVKPGGKTEEVNINE